ncbi:MAG: sugar phosphate isomerase/epimerase [Chloroflexi bacterium]|nr:sugar phosphate isomerase/epimerase [Chloroflexota bacterium]
MLAINTDYMNSYGNPEPRLRHIADAGFSQIHWCHHFGSDYIYTDDEIDQILQWLQSCQLAVNDLHASHGEHNHYYSTDETIHLAGLQLVKNRIHMANRLDTDVIVLHLPRQPDEAGENAAFWQAVHRSMDELIPYARDRSLRIAFENLASNHTTLHKVLAAYDPSDVGICYDPGHGNIVGDGLDFAEAVKDRLIAFHLNDNDSTADQHNLIFAGSVDWGRLAKIIAASAYDKEYMTIEFVMPKERGNFYADDEAGFLAQAMASGLKFHKMVADARLDS